MKRICIVAAGSAVLLFLFSCKAPTDSDSGTIIGSGTLVTQVRSHVPFHSVELFTVGTVNVRSGSEQKISITVDDNILEYVRTTVSNGSLLINLDPGRRFSNLNLTIDLTMTDLEALSNSGAGSITGINPFAVDNVRLNLAGAGHIILELDAAELDSTLSGAGNIVLNGSVGLHGIAHSAAGNVLAFGLITGTTNISMSGAGRAEVYVNQLLDVTISGAGSVYYRGRPTVVQNITGTGQLIDAN